MRLWCERWGERGLIEIQLAFDENLSRRAVKHPHLVGYADGQPILYPHLAEQALRRLSITVEEGMALGWTAQQVCGANQAAELAEDERGYLQAYCGWLMCNAGFRKEHDELVEQELQQ